MEDYGLTDQDFQGNAAQFDIEYLEHISSDPSEPSELARQSLYVKFDPLVGDNSPNRTIFSADHNAIDKGENINTLESDAGFLSLPTGKELMYSEDEVTKKLKILKQKEIESEGKKYNEEVAILQQELLEAQELVLQLKSVKGVKATIKQLHRQDVAQLEYKHQQWEALSAKHEDLEAVIVDCHEKRKKAMVSHQEKTVTAERSLLSLEHSLEDLMQRYSSLKNHSSNLEDRQVKLKQDIENLETGFQRFSEEYRKLKQQQISLVDKGNTSYESLQKELASKLAVERVTTKKLELRVVTLTCEQENKTRDKEQLTRICDELLQELNKTS
ncbi:transforming acidic coiled-coil-containing protein 3-like isoform X2 [Halichondria panicea]|uniref:transforming acidic coiled-coil-containing protein 3-like isoform X2 n=1 Tax=Halichondria panicea TaxID=6063 RepID=UPI00312B861B